jgi:DNA modification methylase
MYRVLKPTGSIFLHCDWHADAYIRVEILDKIFGADNFRNHIIWKRAETVKGNFGQGKKSLDYNTDTIFFYSKSNSSPFVQPFKKYSEDYINQFYKYQESDGRKYQLIAIDGPGGASKGNPQYELMGVTRYWRYSKTKMDELVKQGLIVQTRPGNVPRKKQYLDDGKGVPHQNLWDDLPALQSQSKERIGYPTQKPEALMERIIKMATGEGDVVFDPFVGGGTTVAVADKLKRRWIGIDQSAMAVKVTEIRLERQRDLFSQPYTVCLHKYDRDALRSKDPSEFESWIIQQFGGVPQNKKGGDRGIDGKAADGSPVQVKRSENIGVNVVKNFSVSAKQFNRQLFEKRVADKKPVGYIIAFSFGSGAVEEAARLKLADNIIIGLVKVEDIVPISKKPALTLDMTASQKSRKDVWEIEFTARGESKAGIEFYSWDFAYNAGNGFRAEVMIDKAGVQKRAFKAGAHTVAVKVFDNDGLENIEAVKIKVNGAVETVQK